jgi:hypothetical protein
MKVESRGRTFELSDKELDIWMTALRAAALEAVKYPYRSGKATDCPFLKQHGELSRLTGIGAGDHAALVRSVLSEDRNRSVK